MAKTKIEWATHTWNPVTGCTPVSEGCANCYAARIAKRLTGRAGYPKDNPFKVTLHPDKLDEPLRWRKPRNVFVASMGDLFHEDVKPIQLVMIFQVIEKCPQHTFMLLTKRPEVALEHSKNMMLSRYFNLPNVWLGVTAENQKRADERIPTLLQIPAAVRFISVEPMLEAIDLKLGPMPPCSHRGCYHHITHPCERCGRKQGRLPVDWIICGGESGPGARPMHPDWARNLRDQCQTAGVPFLFKQWGEWKIEHKQSESVKLFRLKDNQQVAKAQGGGHWLFTRVGKKRAGRLLDGQVWNQFPEIKSKKENRNG